MLGLMIKLNGVEVKATIFPDKTSQVWKLSSGALEPSTDVHDVEWHFESEAEFLHLAQLKRLLDSTPFPSYLYLPYLPYARQDKSVSNEQTFALHAFIPLLNSLAFTEVHVIDPHSDVYKAIYNVVHLGTLPYIRDAIRSSEVDTVCFPDSGAFKRYSDLIPTNIKTVSAYKIRDQLTGEITQYGFTEPNAAHPLHVNAPKINGKSVLIIDDICDGGATFKHCAEKLLEAGAKEVHLYVTHGLFTKGLQTLRDSGIKRIFTRKGETV